MSVHYDSRVRVYLVTVMAWTAVLLSLTVVRAQETTPKQESPKTEPQYEDTFSGPIVELTAEKITVTRSVLGQPAEKRTFWIKQDTKIEGKLKVKTRVTVGFVSGSDGDVARLIVVRNQQKK